MATDPDPYLLAMTDGNVCGTRGGSRWCPDRAEHGGPCTCDWAVVEGRRAPVVAVAAREKEAE